MGRFGHLFGFDTSDPAQHLLPLYLVACNNVSLSHFLAGLCLGVLGRGTGGGLPQYHRISLGIEWLLWADVSRACRVKRRKGVEGRIVCGRNGKVLPGGRLACRRQSGLWSPSLWLGLWFVFDLKSGSGI